MYDLKFVEAAEPGDEIVTDRDEYRRAMSLFEEQIRRAEAWLKHSHQDEAAVREWLVLMRAECWMPSRTVLVRRPVR